MSGWNHLHAQVGESQAKALLAEKNIPEDTLRIRLLKKGYDLDNLSPSQLTSIQRVIEETIKEIETSQGKRESKESLPKENPEPIPPPVIISANLPAPSSPPAEQIDNSIYGQQIFRNNTIGVYKTSQDAVVPDDYVLDVGDQIGVVGFGRSQFNYTFTITKEGFIDMGSPGDRLPKILLRGVRWSEAQEILYQRYSQYFPISRGEFQAIVVQPRNMTVNVFGEARTTGAITLPGVNNAFNVISAAGGPTDIGSVRRIKIIRGGQTIPLDVYAFMNDPSVSRNYYLHNNDYIHIPVAQKVVKIEGAVTRPYRYELLDNENLIQLIEFAGGSRADAYLTDVRITRFFEDRKVITSVNFRELKAKGGDYVLLNGDVIEVKAVDDDAENFVSVLGAVSFPGAYEKKEGMRISDLIAQSGLKSDARLDFAFLLHYQPDGTYRYERVDLGAILSNPASSANLLLNNQDRMEVMTLRTYARNGFFSVEGAVTKPDTFAFTPDGKLYLDDAILLAGGLKPGADVQGFIIRHSPDEPKTVDYIPVNFADAAANSQSVANVAVEFGDVIRVFDKGARRDEIFVEIFGSVRLPGRYPFGFGMTLSDLVELAGGLTYDADRTRIDIARVELVDGQNMKIQQSTNAVPVILREGAETATLKPFDNVYVRAIPEFELQQTIRVEGEVKYPGSYALLVDKERISDMITRAGGLTGGAFPEGAKLYRTGDSTGLVIIDLAAILENPNNPSNVVLLAGDIIQIPKNKDLVTIEGEVNLDNVYTPNFLHGQKSLAVAFRGPKNAKYYVDQYAGGVNDNGSAARIKVQYADGHVENTQKILAFNHYPKVKAGSHIIVEAKPVKPQITKEQDKTDWSSVLKDTMAQATAVLTLLILVDQLSK